MLVAMLVMAVLCFGATGCAPKEPENPYKDFGTEQYRVTFSDKDAIASTTICFNEEFSKENISITAVDGFKDNAISANIKLPDPTNVWWVMGIGFKDTNRYEGNFKNLKKIAFTYTSTVDYSAMITAEEVNISVQFAIKSVKANDADEQTVFDIKATFPIANKATPTAFSLDIPEAVQAALNANTKNLYLDWMMIPIEEAGEGFKPGKLAIDDIAFFA